jgi:hypothetical protein
MLLRVTRLAGPWVLLSTVVLAVIGGLWFMGGDQGGEVIATHQCQLNDPNYGGKVQSITLKPFGNSDGSVTLPFGRSRQPDARRVQFSIEHKVNKADRSIRLIPTDFLRTENGGRLPDGRVHWAWSVVGRLVTVWVCIDPTGVPPGEYDGNLLVRDRRFRPATIPVTTTIQYAGWSRVLIAVFLAFLAAAFAKYVQAQRDLEHDPFSRDTPVLFGRWIVGRAGSLGVAVGAVTTIFLSQYWGNPSWGSNSLQVLTLMGATFAAVMTAVSGGELAKPTTTKTRLKSRLAGRETSVDGDTTEDAETPEDEETSEDEETTKDGRGVD